MENYEHESSYIPTKISIGCLETIGILVNNIYDLILTVTMRMQCTVTIKVSTFQKGFVVDIFF